MPPKKRKAPEANGGTPAPKKKMTKSEKQQALDRAQQWAQERKAATAASPSRMRAAAAAVSVASSAKKATSKQQELQEARARAAAWAAGDVTSPPAAKRKPGRPRKSDKSPLSAQVEAPKRKPGRPRKSENPPTPVPKRKPGRPRKSDALKSPPPPTEAPKRKPGRPRKSDTLTSPQAQAAPKRKPGRPRKSNVLGSPPPVAAATRKKAPPATKSSPTSQQETVASPTSKQEAVASPVVAETPTPKAETTQETIQERGEAPKKGWLSRLKIVVAVIMLVASFSMAACALLSPTDGFCSALCDGFSTWIEFVADATKKPLLVQDSVAAETIEETSTSSIAESDANTPSDEPGWDWQSCNLFTAPTKVPSGGWGVFAAKDFEKHELVEVAPLYLTMDYGIPVVKNTVLDDYIYGYTREATNEQMAAVSLGYVMFYNHGIEPNVVWMGFGKEPTESNPNTAKVVGLVATRDIRAGEELFSSYGLEDGGENWFRTRRLERHLLTTEQARLSPKELKFNLQRHCSRVFGGYGKESFESKIMNATPLQNRPKYASQSLSPLQDAGFGNIYAKVPMKPGDVVETVPALALHRDFLAGSALAPLVMSWSVLGGANRITLREMRETGKLTIQHQSPDTSWRRVDRWDEYSNLAILPAGGTIAMMERAGIKSEEANCRVQITASGSDSGSAGLIVRVVANKVIGVGEKIKLAVNPEGTEEEHNRLYANLKRTGQPLFGTKEG